METSARVTPRMHPAWLRQKERGSAFLMAIIARVALVLGRPFAAALLYPICAYFLVFSGPARRASREYLRRVLPRRPGWGQIFRHYHCFASTILDGVFFHAGKMTDYRCEIEGLELLERHITTGRGCLLFGAHFGSFDVLRALALAECRVGVRVLMHDRQAAKLARVMKRLNARMPAQVIPLGHPQTMLAVRDALAAGELVALLADRSVHGDRHVACPFLGDVAQFPQGPFTLVALLEAPVVLFSAAYCGEQRYQVRFQTLAEAGTDAPDRNAALERRCRNYARWLEACCRSAPYNWFNFYDFWAPREGPP